MRLVRATAVALSLLCSVSTAQSGEKFIPAAAHAPGANGTFFSTDLRIVNLASSPATFELAWLPSNSDNTSPRFVTVTVAGRASRQIDDAALALFDVPSGGGAIRISSSAEFVATSRTYTTSSNSGCPGTFGQFIPAVATADAAERSVVASIRSSSDPASGFRSNIGVVNPSRDPVTVTVRLRSGSGASFGAATLQLLPLGHTQVAVASTFGFAATDDNLFVEIEATKPVIAYGSIVDNRSGDPIFITATRDTGTPAATATVITARQWVFEPPLIEARVGEEKVVIVKALDVDHGIGISGVGAVSCSSEQGSICVLKPGEEVTLRFTPREAGTFAFFCTRFCGAAGQHSHETMRGTVVVR